MFEHLAKYASASLWTEQLSSSFFLVKDSFQVMEQKWIIEMKFHIVLEHAFEVNEKKNSIRIQLFFSTLFLTNWTISFIDNLVC